MTPITVPAPVHKSWLKRHVARLGTGDARHELYKLHVELEAEAVRLGKDLDPVGHDAVLVGDIATASIAVLRILTMLGAV